MHDFEQVNTAINNVTAARSGTGPRPVARATEMGAAVLPGLPFGGRFF
ncbi:hypothetical protein [Burkholderia ubonensis]|nr:hypothetical protein [Burkholderia ubonensis]